MADRPNLLDPAQARYALDLLDGLARGVIQPAPIDIQGLARDVTAAIAQRDARLADMDDALADGFAERDALRTGLHAVEAERDALRGAVEAVREWIKEEWGRSYRPLRDPFHDGYRVAVSEIAALLAAARIEAGLATSRERPGHRGRS